MFSAIPEDAALDTTEAAAKKQKEDDGDSIVSRLVSAPTPGILRQQEEFICFSQQSTGIIPFFFIHSSTFSHLPKPIPFAALSLCFRGARDTIEAVDVCHTACDTQESQLCQEESTGDSQGRRADSEQSDEKCVAQNER